jgi:hypothetical protein
MLRVISLLAAAAAAALACGGSTPPAKPTGPTAAAAPIDAGPGDAPPLDQDLERLAQRSLDLYRAMAKALGDASRPCSVATTELGQLRDEYREVVATNAKVIRDGRAKELRAALAPRSEEFDRAAKAVLQSPTMSKCHGDHAFTKAFDDLVEPPP